MTQHQAERRAEGRRRMRPASVAVVAILVVVLALAALGLTRLVGSAAGHGPPTQPDNRGTTREEAERRARGEDPRGVNSSQDAYTSQNQSREPEPR